MVEKGNLKLGKTNILMVFILMTLGFVACSDYKPNYAEPTIEEDKMALIMADLHILEAYLQNTDPSKRDSIKSLLYDQLFKIHQLDSTTFYKNHKIYFSNSKTIEPLYEKVLEQIEVEAKKIEK